MGILQITLFGGVHVTLNNWLTEEKITRDIQALLSYFLLQRHRTHSRETLAGLFWGDNSQEKARGSLNTALWRLKKALEPKGIPRGTYLNARPGEVGFNKESQYWLDVEVFENAINRILKSSFKTIEEPQVVELENTLKLYKGDLLEGFFDDWALREREKFRSLYEKCLFYLLQYYGFQGAYDKAIAYGQHILELDPLRERIHREMMKLYIDNGQRTKALRQYDICRYMLATEFGVAPMEETQALYTYIMTRSSRQLLPIISEGRVSVDQALGQLREADKAIDHIKEQIQHTIQLISNYSEHLE